MKKDTQTVSRRNFLSKSAGVAAAVTASILVIETPAANNALQTPKAIGGGSSLFDCTQAQTLINKVIPSIDNILGTDYVNVREFNICGTDITDALNDAIDSLKNSGSPTDVPRGGQILIPRGRWTTRGEHDLYPSISIEGVGTQIDPNYFGVPWGTEITLVADENKKVGDYMFRLVAGQHNCSLKNLSIDLTANDEAIGLLMTDGETSGSHLKYTAVENVSFLNGGFGIRVDSSSNFECIQHRFERVIFTGCKTSFYSNTANCGYSFDTCYFLLPHDGIALHLTVAGSVAVEHCLFVPSVGALAHNSTILKTVGAFNSISFYNCQDEGLTYAYQNDVNQYDYISVVYRNCLIQSLFKFNSHGSVVLDSCRVGSWDTFDFNGTVVPIGGAFIDSLTAAAKVYLKGQYNFFRWAPTIMYLNAPIADFDNTGSRLIFESSEVGEAEIIPASATVPANYVINKTRGLINIDTGTNNILVYNNLVTADSMVFAQLQSQDSGGARIREVQCYAGLFYIFLSAAASNKIRVAFKVEL